MKRSVPSRPTSIPRRRGISTVLTVLLAFVLAMLLPGASGATGVAASETSIMAGGPGTPVKPTIVFVHGAFADASGFSDSIITLQRAGYPVLAPANPLRGLSGDADSLRTFLSTLTGPLILVGHSYGGAVITNAATGNPNVKALVYIAAYALRAGESVSDANSLGGGHSDLLDSIYLRPIPGFDPVPPPEGNLDAYIKVESFQAVFAADVPKSMAAVMAATQRPAALTSLGEPSGEPAWKTIPSWYLVASQDKAIPPEAERAMAARANAKTVEIRSSHAAMVSHPRAVTALILAAVAGTK